MIPTAILYPIYAIIDKYGIMLGELIFYFYQLSNKSVTLTAIILKEYIKYNDMSLCHVKYVIPTAIFSVT